MSCLSKQKVKEEKQNMLEASLGLHAITNMQRTNFLKSTHCKHYLDVHLQSTFQLYNSDFRFLVFFLPALN